MAGSPGPNQQWPNLSSPGPSRRAYELHAANPKGKAFWRELISGPECKDMSPRLGLISYPAELPQAMRPKLLVPCSLYGAAGQCALPPELRGDLGDFNDGCRRMVRGKSPKDPEQIFAEQAAAARIIREHALRLALDYKPEVLAVGYSGLAVINQTSGMPMGYDSFYADQVEGHAQAMASNLGLDQLFFITEGGAAGPPMATPWLDGHQHGPGGRNPFSWRFLAACRRAGDG